MSELLLGISGAIVFFLFSHLAMLTFYKKYDYWWHYYCDLGYAIPENRTSTILYKSGLVFLAVSLLPLWLNIDAYLTLNVALIQGMGIVGCLSFILMIIFPYERSRVVHFFSLFMAFTGLSAALVIANQELQSVLLTIYFWCFLVYISVLVVTTAKYRKEMKRAHRYQAPVQKTFVLLFDIAVVVFCMLLAAL